MIYNQYNKNYGYLINNLRDRDFDVYIIRFNYSNKPVTHGMQQSADLFEDFLNDVNDEKEAVGSNYENVIAASSYGADVVRMALMQMEKKHFEANGPHHHTRLYMAVDAQFYGANVPLASQYLIMSHFWQQSPLDLLNGSSPVLNNYLYSAMLSKGALELLTYSAWAGNFNFPFSPWARHDITPTHHGNRQNVLNRFQQLDRSDYFIPMQLGTRNVAVSMGKYNVTNYTDEEENENWYRDRNSAPGDNYFIHTDFKFAQAAIYSNDHTKIFQRKSFFGGLHIPFVFTHQSMAVKHMYEIDNTSGSYHKGFANVTSTWDFANAATVSGGGRQTRYTHKPVVSALAINENLWPNSMHLNMHGLGLMWDKRNFDPDIDEQSEFYGYPNLGKPNDHFDITPFEAIYVDKWPDPHISMKDRPFADELRDFYLQETEPKVLMLQNDELGGQARTNYRYKAKRRAEQGVLFSRSKSPMTDIGPYIIKANAELVVSSGGWVATQNPADFPLGTVIFDTEPGSVFEWNIINFDNCDNSKNGDLDEDDAYLYNVREKPTYFASSKNEIKIASNISIAPNPSLSDFTVRSKNGEEITSIELLSLEGKLIEKRSNINSIQFLYEPNIDRGEYILIVTTNNGVYQEKLIKL